MNKLYYKSRWIKENGLEQQLIVTFSLKYKRYAEDLRQKQVERAELKIANPASLEKKKANDPGRFVKRLSVTQDGELSEKDLYFLDKEAIAKEVQ